MRKGSDHVEFYRREFDRSTDSGERKRFVRAFAALQGVWRERLYPEERKRVASLSRLLRGALLDSRCRRPAPQIKARRVIGTVQRNCCKFSDTGRPPPSMSYPTGRSCRATTLEHLIPTTCSTSIAPVNAGRKLGIRSRWWRCVPSKVRQTIFLRGWC